MNNIIAISRADFDRMVSYSVEKLPNEACGLLAGKKAGNIVIITRVYFLSNADNSENHFSLEPAEQISAIKDMRKDSLSYLGCWHSHPKTMPFPSEEDIRLAYDDTINYLILSLRDIESPELKAFRIFDNSFKEEKIIIGTNVEKTNE